jgi:hypothetical protein
MVFGLSPRLLCFIAALSASLVAAAQANDLFFSEYLEGSGNNKAIEIFNPTGNTVNLADYRIYRYNNGSTTPTDSLVMIGTLAPGEVYVAGNPSAVAAIIAVSDTLHTITFFNGDDAMELKNISTNKRLDVVGLIGVDPGTNWLVGTGATSEFTLVRRNSVSQGNTNWAVNATEWDVYPQNTTSFLGSHTMNPLPVKLLWFRGTRQQNGATLRWEVAEQEHINYYEVLRSIDGVQFDPVSRIKANTQRRHIYQFVDAGVPATAYYRLRIVEQGQQTYSPVLQLSKKTAGIAKLAANVVQHDIQLLADAGAALPCQLTLLSAGGQVVMKERATAFPFRMSVRHLLPGVYFLHLQNGRTQSIQKFIKE